MSASAREQRRRPLLREQTRALLAHRRVAALVASERGLEREYATAVWAFATGLRQIGLAAALSQLERQGSAASKQLLSDLAQGELPGLGDDGAKLPARAREIDDLQAYMLATRELIRLSEWFVRAVQAQLGDTRHAE